MKRLLVLLSAIVIACTSVVAQRRITPVTPSTPSTSTSTSPSTPSTPSSIAHYHDDNGNIVLVDTVTGVEWVDTTAMRRPGYVYPRLNGVTVGVDIWDPVMRALGQKFGGAAVMGEVSFHNRFAPVFEFGLSTTRDTPEAMNFTYTSPLAPYFKIGLNYNFLYNNNSDYQLYALARYGFTHFSYSLTDVTVDDAYWGEQVPVDFPPRNVTAGYYELGLGVKVKIVGRLSMGWMAKFHGILHQTKSTTGEPMVIPGYGKNKGSITGGFLIMYTFDVNKRP